jgi:integrase
MSRRKEARLYLRQRKGREPKWVILDGGREYPAGDCGSDRKAAEKFFLEEYTPSRYRRDTSQGDPSKITVAQVMSLYMTECAPHHASPALAGYHSVPLLKFFRGKSLADINGGLCRKYAETRGKEVSQSTVRRELVTLQAAINYWHGESQLAAVPKIIKPAESVAVQRFLTRHEAAKMLWFAYRNGYKHIVRFILIGIYSGTRHATILSLKWYPSDYAGHVDIEGGKLYRRGAKVGQTNKRRPTSRLPDRLMAHLRRWHRMDLSYGPQSAIIRWHGKPIAKEKRAWKEVVIGAGLGDDVTPHVLKHTCITWALQNGMELWDISGLSGTSLKTIEGTYGHQDADYQVAAAKAFVRKIA